MCYWCSLCSYMYFPARHKGKQCWHIAHTNCRKMNILNKLSRYNNRGVLLGIVAFLLFILIWQIKSLTKNLNSVNATSSPSPLLLDQLIEDQYFSETVDSLEQDNVLLHKYVRLRHLTPPSKRPYDLPGTGSFGNGHTALLDRLFKSKRNGTFIEAGAYDGVAASNSLFFEKELGWSGLLVECNPVTVPILKMKRRKAWIADVCLSPTTKPATLNFSNPTSWGPSAKLGEPVDLTKWGVDTKWTQFEVPAIPLFALLSAINLTQIDFLSLDVEGAEINVLKTIPFDKISIKVIDMEVHYFTEEQKSELREFLTSKGYKLYQSFDVDDFYVHSSLEP